ncbi:FYVE, RhoGEF and PH domain-containing protein 6-like [Diadema antillarum]|uniref:FYVE, RhoGEF and PH domain-containing protein 6-like n=1 Tax=Diadema antillarum TaxID=105358 RepID=UPI003A8A99D3
MDIPRGVEGPGDRARRSPSDRSVSLSDSSGGEEFASQSDEDEEDDYAGVADIHISDDGFEEEELPDARKRLQSLGRKAQKAFMVAKEIKDSEKVFVDVLKLLNVDLRQAIDEKSKKLGGKPLVEKATLDQIIGHLPHLLIFNECLLTDLESRIRNWSTNPRIADIFLTKGHFLKLYSQYILDFKNITAAFDEACNKNPLFCQAVKEFEMSPRCQSLAIKHYMLKPVQRIPQYKLLLTDYLKQLDANSEEHQKTTDALNIVSEVANHANESMRQGDNFEKLLAIQHSLIGSQEIVKPGRIFIKEGELQKMSRRVNQPRKFFLLSDILLHTTPFPPGQYKLNNELSLAGMKVSRNIQDDCYELSIISVQRSFTLLASSKEDGDSWYEALTKTIEEYESKKSSFGLGRPELRPTLSEGDSSSLGRKAPLWIPDSRVTMCMICTSEFTITWRRHHCRACGKVTCGNCSRNKAPLTYLKSKEARVCDNCYETLVTSQGRETTDSPREKKERSKTNRKKSNRQPVRPSALKVCAKDQTNSSMSGYLWMRKQKKDWKRLWYRIKDKVLYSYKASEDVVALQSMPLLGYAVCVINEPFEGFEAGLILQLTQGPMKHILRADTVEACGMRRWWKQAACSHIPSPQGFLLSEGTPPAHPRQASRKSWASGLIRDLMDSRWMKVVTDAFFPFCHLR